MEFYSVMLFYSEAEIGMSGNFNRFIHSKDIDCGNNGQKALDLYSNIMCPASQLIEADSLKELNLKKKEMVENFNNSSWVEELVKSI